MEYDNSTVGAKRRGYKLLAFLAVLVVANLIFLGFYSTATGTSSEGGIVSQSQMNLNAYGADSDASDGGNSFVGTGNVVSLSDNSDGKSSNKKSSNSRSSSGSDKSNINTDTILNGDEIPETEEEFNQALMKLAPEQGVASDVVVYKAGENNPDFNGNGVVDFSDFIM
ncbi:MAG: hypothetical protein Q8P81_01205, partial [Nanoarchaeota archaeon]|nr:hypothetical protein [Nanoarchaeota archaeon]